MKISNIRYAKIQLYGFLTQNNLSIFVILMDFVKILTLNANKKLIWI